MGLKLLFVRFSSIGDIVLTSAAIRCAKQQLEGVEIHFLTKKSMKAVTEANPYIDHFHYLENDFALLLRKLKYEKFDYIIDLHKNLRTFRLKWALKVPTLAFNKANVEKFMLTKWGINRMPDRHVVLRNVDALAPLGVHYDGQGLDHFVPPTTQMPALPAMFASNYVAFVIGATYFTKKLPVEKIIDLIGRLDAKIVLVGGKQEQAEGQEIAKHFPEKVLNTCGKYNLHESTLLVKNAKLVIAHDTGLMHISCAFQKDLIMLWGGTALSLQYYHFYPDNAKNKVYDAQVPGLSCQPCSHFGLNKCPKGHFKCMNQQDIPIIAAAAQAILNKN